MRRVILTVSGIAVILACAARFLPTSANPQAEEFTGRVVALDFTGYQPVSCRASLCPDVIGMTANQIGVMRPSVEQLALGYELSDRATMPLTPKSLTAMAGLGEFRGFTQSGALLAWARSDPEGRYLIAVTDGRVEDVTPANFSTIIASIPRFQVKLEFVGKDIPVVFALPNEGSMQLWMGREELKPIPCSVKISAACQGFDETGRFLWFQGAERQFLRLDTAAGALTAAGLERWSPQLKRFAELNGTGKMQAALTNGACAIRLKGRVIVLHKDGREEEVELRDLLSFAPDGRRRTPEESDHISKGPERLVTERDALPPNVCSDFATTEIPLSDTSIAVLDLLYGRAIVFSD